MTKLNQSRGSGGQKDNYIHTHTRLHNLGYAIKTMEMFIATANASTVQLTFNSQLALCLLGSFHHLCPNNQPCLQRLQIGLTLMSTLSGCFQGYCHDTLQNYSLRIRSQPHIVTAPESPVRTPITQSSYLSSKRTRFMQQNLPPFHPYTRTQTSHSQQRISNNVQLGVARPSRFG